jgi:hypothetical protein
MLVLRAFLSVLCPLSSDSGGHGPPYLIFWFRLVRLRISKKGVG